MASSLRVFIADDHPFLRAGVRAELERASLGWAIAGEASNGPGLMHLLAHAGTGDAREDVLVTDFAMAGASERDCDGMALLFMLRRQYPGLHIIVLTEIENPALLRAMIDVGVQGLVDKISATCELVYAIRKVVVGKIHYSREVRMLLDHMGGSGAGQVRISPHEAEVVRLFVGGLRVSEIALRLSRSVKTISRQKSDAMQKLGIDNHSQLYAYARDNGLVS